MELDLLINIYNHQRLNLLVGVFRCVSDAYFVVLLDHCSWVLVSKAWPIDMLYCCIYHWNEGNACPNLLKNASCFRVTGTQLRARSLWRNFLQVYFEGSNSSKSNTPDGLLAANLIIPGLILLCLFMIKLQGRGDLQMHIHIHNSIVYNPWTLNIYKGCFHLVMLLLFAIHITCLPDVPFKHFCCLWLWTMHLCGVSSIIILTQVLANGWYGIMLSLVSPDVVALLLLSTADLGAKYYTPPHPCCCQGLDLLMAGSSLLDRRYPRLKQSFSNPPVASSMLYNIYFAHLGACLFA